MPISNAIVKLLQVPAVEHDLAWLKQAMQAAVELEYATIPPYLTAYWSVKNSSDASAVTIRQIAIDEMLHMGLVCNMLTGLGQTPVINTPAVLPTYPGPLPGGVHPELIVGLSGLSQPTADLFTKIERPLKPLAALETFAT